jgi:hypothetical protein
MVLTEIMDNIFPQLSLTHIICGNSFFSLLPSFSFCFNFPSSSRFLQLSSPPSMCFSSTLFLCHFCEGFLLGILFIYWDRMEPTAFLLGLIIWLFYQPWIMVGGDYGAFDGMNDWQGKPQ